MGPAAHSVPVTRCLQVADALCWCPASQPAVPAVAGEEDVHPAPAIEDPTGGTAELEAELLHTPGPTGLPAHAAEGVPPCAMLAVACLGSSQRV